MPDETLPDFEMFRDRVYFVTRHIPEGRVATYGDIALLAGSPRAARAVGQALNRLLGQESDIPWHRVINAKGRISIRDDMNRARRQRRYLRDDGVEMTGWSCDLSAHRWSPERLFWSETPPDDM
jgi:methylated-DNA-protein-cysteine methyltransferase-like protein